MDHNLYAQSTRVERNDGRDEDHYLRYRIERIQITDQTGNPAAPGEADLADSGDHLPSGGLDLLSFTKASSLLTSIISVPLSITDNPLSLSTRHPLPPPPHPFHFINYLSNFSFRPLFSFLLHPGHYLWRLTVQTLLLQFPLSPCIILHLRPTKANQIPESAVLVRLRAHPHRRAFDCSSIGLCPAQAHPDTIHVPRRFQGYIFPRE